ncbi:MAG: sigma-70 family RNA polymerase sigma factor [Paraprevotella sp.]|nr:sigma-70 family RNA polymerase sigma factor [Paraprevotella sp.]
MARTTKNSPKTYSDAAYVDGVSRRDPVVMKDFYLHCKKYFEEHYRSVFFASEHDRKDIFQNTYIALWENIERGKIHIKDGILKGRNDEPFKGSLLTYMMSIGKLKYLEWVRKESREPNFNDSLPHGRKGDEEPAETAEWLSDNSETGMLEAISEGVSVMSDRCREILTKFYYENKKLDMMLSELPSYKSKDALKSNKNRCLKMLKTSVANIYRIRREM